MLSLYHTSSKMSSMTWMRQHRYVYRLDCMGKLTGTTSKGSSSGVSANEDFLCPKRPNEAHTLPENDPKCNLSKRRSFTRRKHCQKLFSEIIDISVSHVLPNTLPLYKTETVAPSNPWRVIFITQYKFLDDMIIFPPLLMRRT